MRRFVAVLSATLVLALGQNAAAFDNDFDYSKLGVPGAAVPERAADPFAQERFARFVGDLAMAIAPSPSAPMYTLGGAAFELAFTTDVALVNPTQTFNDGNAREVWPTIGARPSALVMPTVHLRKGLPFSLQAGTSISYITGSSMAVSSFDLKWALLEGLQWWPSIGVRAFGSVLVNSGPMLLVLGGWDIGGDYRFPIAGSLEAVLYGGYQRMGFNASTGNIDFVPENEDPRNPSADDRVFAELPFGNVFAPISQIQRAYFGFQLRHKGLVFGADAVSASGNYPTAGGSDSRVDVRSWRFSAKLGVVF